MHCCRKHCSIQCLTLVRTPAMGNHLSRRRQSPSSREWSPEYVHVTKPESPSNRKWSPELEYATEPMYTAAVVPSDNVHSDTVHSDTVHSDTVHSDTIVDLDTSNTGSPWRRPSDVSLASQRSSAVYTVAISDWPITVKKPTACYAEADSSFQIPKLDRDGDEGGLQSVQDDKFRPVAPAITRLLCKANNNKQLDDATAAVRKHHEELREAYLVSLTPSNDFKVCDILRNSGFSTAHWESLAPRLGVKDTDSILAVHPWKPFLCLKEVISRWINSDPEATWEKLAAEVSKVEGYGSSTTQRILMNAQGGDFVTSAHSAISPAISRYADYLKAYYSRALVAPEIPERPKFPPTPSKIYINLALVKKEDISRSQADAFTKATLHGNIDEILRKKEQICLEDVFKAEVQTSLKCILVEGAPGVGKSTFAWELCQRWDVMAAMRRFSLVVLLRLREKRVQEARTVADLFYHDDSSLQEAVAHEVIANNGLNTLLILDGFDEYPSRLRKASLITEIIQGARLPNCTVLVTSRPSARADLSFAQSQMHKHIEVLGFTQKQIEEYACSVFGSDKQLLSDFLTYISTNQAIRNVMYVPLNSAIVVKIYRENRIAGMPIPQTMTQLYTDLSHTLLRRYLSEKGDTRADRLPQKLEDLQPDLHAQLMNLARLAFEGVVREKVIFSDLPEGLGFVNATEELYCSDSPMSYNFHHLTLQEFLGALYFSMLPVEPVNERMKAFEQHASKKQMDVIWRFVAGLTSFRGIGWEVVQAKSGRKKDGKVTPFLIQCLYEAQEEAAYESVLGTGEVVFKGAGTMSPVDCFAVGDCIAASKCAWELLLDWNGMGAEMVEMLVCGLKSKKEVGGCIRKLDLSFNPIRHEGVAHITMIQPHKVLQQLSELNVQFCELDSNTPNLLSTIIPGVMTSLRMLNISINPVGASGMAKLLTSLSNLSSFHTLIMHDTNIASDDLTALSQLIRPTGSLRTLWIGDKGMPAECTELMMKTVLAPSSLKELAILGVDFTSCSTVFTFLEDNHNLTWLTTHLCKIGSHGTSCLANALHRNTTLKTLQLFMLQVPLSGQIGTEGALALSEMLKINSSLQWLRIDADNSLGHDGIRAILSSLQDNHTLKELPSSLYIRRTIH